MFGHRESKLNQTTQIFLWLFARTCHIVPKSRSTSGVNRKKEPSFQFAAAILLDQRRGFRANPILHSLYHYYYDYYPTKAFPSLPSCFKNDDTFCNAMILETIFPTDKKWWDEGDAGHRAARPKITWYLPSIFSQESSKPPFFDA